MTETKMQIPNVCLNCEWAIDAKPNRGDEFDASMPIVTTCTHEPKWERIVDGRFHWCSHYSLVEQPRFTVPAPAEEEGGEQ